MYFILLLFRFLKTENTPIINNNNNKKKKKKKNKKKNKNKKLFNVNRSILQNKHEKITRIIKYNCQRL